MRRVISIFFLLWNFVLFFICYGSAQDVEVYVEPKKAYVGTEIRVYGFVEPSPGRTYCRLEFIKEGPSIVEQVKAVEQVQAEANGDYEYVFRETSEPGMWKVRAWKEGTQSYAEETFEISSRIFMADLVKSLEDLEIEKTREGFYLLDNLLENYPTFPNKDQMQDDINSLLQEIERAESLFQKFDTSVKEMENSLETHSGKIPARASEALRKASDISMNLAEKIQSESAEIDQLLKESRQEADWCYLWSTYYDFCSKLSNAANFIATGLGDIAQNLMVAELTKDLDFDVQQKIQTVLHIITTAPAPSPSVIGFTNFMMGTISGLAASTYKELLNSCTQYKGKAEGEYHAELRHEGLPFFTMDYKLKGEITLVFQKRKPKDPAVHLKGRFKGRIQDTECSITMVPFKLPSEELLLARCWSALPLIAGRSFLLYLEGRALDDKMEIEFKKAERDFKLEAKAYYVLLSHHILPIPGTFNFPLMNAEWFFTRVTKLSLKDTDFFILPIKVEGDKSAAERTFERSIHLPATPRRKETAVELKLKIKICSPECK